MTWESTGDKRVPKKGEFAHCNWCERIHECEDPSDWGIAVIMRPVEEPKRTVKQWCTVIPFGTSKTFAEEAIQEVDEALGYNSLVKELELTLEELA